MIAGRNADSFFHEEVIVEGAEEDLSFNIMIPLPTPPPGTPNVTILLVYTHPL